MAALLAQANANAVALTTAAARTVAMVKAASNQAIKIRGVRVSFDGPTSTATPVLVELGTPSTDGTMTGRTPLKLDAGRDETVQTGGYHTATVEPTMSATTDVRQSAYVPAYQGLHDFFWPFGAEPIIPGGARFAVRCTAPAGVNCCASILFEE